MPEDLRPPYRIQFDNARDPYTARNALGLKGTGGGITSVSPPLSVTGGILTIDLSGYVAKAGDTMTGALNVTAPTGSAQIQVSAGGGSTLADLYFRNGTANRWLFRGVSTASESGANAGSNFAIARYDDAGTTLISNAILIARATGIVTIGDGAVIKGVTDGSSVAAGNIGEVLTATGSGVAVASATVVAIATITLTAGDWDLWGGVSVSGATAGAPIQIYLATTSGGTTNTPLFYATNIIQPAGLAGTMVGAARISLSGSQAYYLNCGNSGAASLTGAGTIIARRRR